MKLNEDEKLYVLRSLDSSGCGSALSLSAEFRRGFEVQV